jgi:multidrug efflux pump
VLGSEAEIDQSGQAREYRQASGSLVFIFALALAGALVVLWLAGGTLNVYSQIGLVTLVCLIAKHGILIVDVGNRLQEEGISRRDAAIRAATLRLRRILMTTFAMASARCLSPTRRALVPRAASRSVGSSPAASPSARSSPSS